MKKLLAVPAFLALLALVVAVGSVEAETATDYDQPLNVTTSGTSVLHSGTAAAQSLDWDDPLDVQPSNGNPHLAVNCFFDSSGDTADIAVGLYSKDSDGDYHFLGFTDIKQATGIASHTLSDYGTDYVSDQLTFDLVSAPYYDVRVVALSADPVTVTAYTYPAKPTQAE